MASMLLGLAAALAEADTLTIKREAFVKGPKVFLGDIASITGEHAEPLAALEVAPAASPGGFKNFDAAYLMSRIQNAGYTPEELKVSGAPSVKATTMHLEVTQDMVAEDLRRFIETQMPWDAAQAQIDVTAPSQEIVVADGAVSINWRPSPEYKFVGPGAFRGEIAVDGRVQKTILCKANVEAYSSVVIAATDIPRGKVISRNDLTVEKRSMLNLSDRAVKDPAELIGQVARSTIFPGQIIEKRDVAAQILVRRNQMVNVDVQSGTLHIRSTARALNDAREGDIVGCQNPGTKDQFQGVVRRDGAVVVE
ncbi:MAG: flagellar basal body P-ring formation protein FlgA [Candidatus Hydrogenedentes bacterium]|nr:flagellar basal body P-ring formation protein FlgA [Candidatus Hydrogenedentota bacterium]